MNLVDAQTETVQEVLQLLRDQSYSMRDPRSITDQLDGLLSSAEETERGVRDMEELLSLDPDGLLGSGLEGLEDELTATAPAPGRCRPCPSPRRRPRPPRRSARRSSSNVTRRTPLVPALLALACLAPAARAQSPAFDTDFLRDLPSGRDVFSLLETAEPLTVADRIDTGGLFTGEAGRLSARGASWTQATFALDGVDLTDPLTGGRPLFLPWDEALASVDFRIGGVRADVAAPGPLVALVTPRPGDAWTGTLALDSTLGRGDASEPPSIARLDHWRRGALTLAGPLAPDRAGLFVSAQAGSSDRFRRDALETESSQQRSLLAGLDWRVGPADRVRVLLGGQTTELPLGARAVFADEDLQEDGRALHAQALWERTRASGGLWSLTGAYTRATTEGDLGTTVRTIERLIDGPAALLAVPGETSRSRAEAIARYVAAPRGAHALSAGVRVRHASRARRSRDRVLDRRRARHGIPARIWDYAQPRPLDLSLDEAVLHVADTWRIGERATIDAALPLLYARSADRDASWLTVAPRVGARVRLAGPVEALASWSRDAHALRLDDLAFGDPDAVAASSSRWNDRDGDGAFDESERGLLVARSGPGAPVGSFDADVPRPRTDEWRVGFEAALGPHVRLRLEGIARQSRGLWESVNTGVTENGYDVFFVPDPSGDIVGPSDDQLLHHLRPPAGELRTRRAAADEPRRARQPLRGRRVPADRGARLGRASGSPAPRTARSAPAASGATVRARTTRVSWASCSTIRTRTPTRAGASSRTATT